MSHIPRHVYFTFGLSLFTLSQAALLVRLADAPAVLLGFWRITFAIPLVLTLLLLKKEKISFQFILDHYKTIFISGFLFFIHFAFWFYAVKATTVANATLFFCINPLFVTLGAVLFLNEKLTARLVWALALGVAGIVVVEMDSLSMGMDKVVGDLLAIAASVSFAAYILFSKKLRNEGANLTLTLCYNLICWVGFLFLSGLSGFSFTGFSNVTWLAFFLMAAGPSLLGHALFTYSLKYLDASKASVFILLEPIMAAIMAYLIFSERITTATVIGFVLISVGLIGLYQKKT